MILYCQPFGNPLRAFTIALTLILHYVLIRLNCIIWIWDHPKSHSGETNEPKCWAAALKTRCEKIYRVFGGFVKNGQFHHLSKYIVRNLYSFSTNGDKNKNKFSFLYLAKQEGPINQVKSQIYLCYKHNFSKLIVNKTIFIFKTLNALSYSTVNIKIQGSKKKKNQRNYKIIF